MALNIPSRASLDPQKRKTSPLLGCELVYWTAGEGSPVLFIQGTGLHGDGWLPQVDKLRKSHLCIWFDNRGMGESKPERSGQITVEQMAADALHVIDEVGLESAHIVGHSLGGCIAMQLALESPERVRSLALLCTAAEGPSLVRMDLPMIWRGIRMNVGSMASRRRAFLEIVLTQAQHEEWDLAQVAAELEPLFGHDLGVTPPIVFRQVRAMGKWNVLSRLPELAGMPTLVVGGDQDVVARPGPVCETAGTIPGAELVRLSDAAHGVVAIEPERINSLLAAHFGKADS